FGNGRQANLPIRSMYSDLNTQPRPITSKSDLPQR
ncbi:MAG: hypothetical protein ACI9LY_003802, partial [Arenicella sp.]